MNAMKMTKFSFMDGFLNQVPTGHKPVSTWFLKIASVHECVCVYICVYVCTYTCVYVLCVYICVCVSPMVLITSGLNMDPI